MRLADALAILAILAAVVTLLSEILHATGRRGWPLALGILATNGLIALGLLFRFRLVTVLAITTTAVLTEVILFRSVMSELNHDWIVIVAVAGCLGLLILSVAGRLGAGGRSPRR